MLDDAHPGLSHRPPLLQNELSVPSSTQWYYPIGRNTGWCLLKCPGHFPHRFTALEVGLSTLQKSGLFSGAIAGTILTYPTLTGSRQPHLAHQKEV